MFPTNMICHLWDLVDEGLDRALDQLQGRIGVAGLCTPVACGPMNHLRYGADVSPRVFRTRGGVFFQPDKPCYENTRCRPLPAEWLRTRNPLQKLVRQCAERGLELRAVIDCTNVGRIASGAPHFARKNVFGDVSPSRMCLANADVAEFIRALTADLRGNYSIDTVELTGLDAMDAAIDEPERDLGVGGRQLMALCFCESCRQAAATAGVDVEQAARSATVRLDAVFRTGQPIVSPLATMAGDDPPLCSFITWYRERISALFQRIRDACGCRVVSRTRPLRSGAEAAVDPGYTRGADAVACHFVGWETAALERLIEGIRRTLAADQRLEVQLPVHSPAMGDDQALVRNLTRAADLGAASANLDHLGRIPREHIEIVKQAIRFARRTN